MRQQVLEYDDFSCLGCGRTKRLEVHHLIPIIYGGEDEFDNLITLCNKCHGMSEPRISIYEIKLLYPRFKSFFPKNITTINISKKLRAQLDKLGDIHEESYNQIIERLIRQRSKK